ncbi:MAG: AraC family transcriptional regulator [Rariglobus sp.]|jgi:AraC-like DNA-binding protein|nr:AraC family transcriptional regulator [Rariglobus sp.]
MPKGSADGTFVRHNELSAWLLHTGSARLVADGRETTVHAGQWLICNAKKIYQELSPDISLLSVRIRHDWPEGTPLFSSNSPVCLFDAAGYPELESIAMEMVKDIGTVKWGGFDRSYSFLWVNRVDYQSYMQQQAHLCLWLGRLAGVVMKQPGWSLSIPAGVDARLAQAMFVIDRQHLNKHYPIEEMEAASGLGIKKLNRISMVACGMTLHAYWEQRRVERARRALEQEGVSVKEIASGLGFTQLSHFSVWFKRHTGEAPREYRGRFITKAPA